MNEPVNSWEYFENEPAPCPQQSVNGQVISEIEGYLHKATMNDIPGAAILIAHKGQVIMKQSFGHLQIVPDKIKNRIDTIYDIASLTKVVATWPAIIDLIHKSRIQLDAPIRSYLHEYERCPLGAVTVSQLLTHSGGLPARTFLKQYGHSKPMIREGIGNEPFEYAPGSQVLYSNRGFVVLGEIVERVSGSSLGAYLQHNIWSLLKMKDTMFQPAPHLIDRIAATEYRETEQTCQRGSVHDENAAILNGVAGHAGLFSTISDLANFCAAVMAGGRFHGRQVLGRELIRQSIMNQTDRLNEARGYGWAIYERSNFDKIVGHYGFTGTSIMLCPALNQVIILLTNRVHPSRENTSIRAIRSFIHEKGWRVIAR